jgi:peptidoglycan/xylan/chitin deacetylase (PgdA/CDA1 family)
MRIALKIDVDTYRGLAEGAPALAGFLSAYKIPASFFVTMGPDTSGRAVLRFLTHRGFGQKMRRTHPLALYGWRTILSGTLLPPRPMASSFAGRLRQYREAGFEVSPHGYDHIRWHDRAAQWDQSTAQQELKKVWEMYRATVGSDPQSFAAPGWQVSAGTWQAMEKLELLYHSDSRGSCPYFPQLSGHPLKTLEIPTTLPTWDEMLAWDQVRPDNIMGKTWLLLHGEGTNVWTIHAEVEGGLYFPQFQEFVKRAVTEDVRWVFLPDWARELLERRETIPVCGVEQAELPGRGGTVTCQRPVQNSRLKMQKEQTMARF